jgi:multidomain signaling protein FimX
MLQSTESISLLFVAQEPEAAERLISCVRMRGPAVRAQQTSDQDGLETLLLAQRFHVIILMSSGDGPSLDAINAVLLSAGRLTPVIVISDRSEKERLEYYESGAFAVVGRGMEDLTALLVLKAVEFHLCSTQVHRLRSGLQEAERRYMRVLEDSKDPVIYTRDGVCLSTNRAWREHFQIDTPEDVAGRQLADFVIPEQHELLRQWLEAHVLGADPAGERRPLTLRTTMGKQFDADLIFTDATIDGENCTVVRMALPGAEDVPGRLSMLDPVTGLCNRQHLFREMERALISAARTERPFALVEISVDDFERLQADLGSSRSDILLTEVGLMIREHFGEPATVAHLGEGNYGILVPGVRRNELEQGLGALIRIVSEREIDLGQGSTIVTLSCGAVIADDSAPTVDGLLDQARQGLDDVRHNGGNGYSFQRPRPDALARSESDRLWKERVLDAMAHDRIRLLYQPIVNLHGGDFPRFSVFVRLTGPDGEVYEPGDFLPAAERTGIAAEIDRWIVRHAVSALSERLKTDSRTTFFLKLTRGSLIDGSVVVWLQEFLHQHRIPATNAVVEVKEATIVTNLKAAVGTAKGLKAIQAQLCIDDFGNGLNPFHILRHVDADYIKLDGAFVRNLVSDENSRRAIRRFTEGGHAKGKQIIVPMVEDAGTLAVLFELGVNLVQGYFVHPPGEQLDFDFTQVL